MLKNELKPHLNEYWCIPPKENAEFVACMDEKPYQLLGEKTEPLPLRPGDIKKTDAEYIRNGTSSIFAFTEVLAGFRHVIAREHRTWQDWAEEAFELSKRLEIHYTPKHGSWLNIAEIELNVLTRQCLARRIDNIDKLNYELAAWETKRNEDCRAVQWHFTTDDARIKLKSLYPKFTP